MSAYISLCGVSYSYKRTPFSIKDVSLGLHRGETTVIAGRNGSGKTTLSKLIMGILRADAGDITVDGQNIEKMRLPEMAKHIGYLFQNPDRQLFCASVLEEITFSLRQKDLDKETAAETANDLLKRFSIHDKADDYPLKLSRGEKQRLALLAVFALQPGYYILDEPSSGIDMENKEKLIAMLNAYKQQGAGLCIITHDKLLIDRLADRVVTMADGRILSDEKT